jgi:hypothetical protein
VPIKIPTLPSPPPLAPPPHRAPDAVTPHSHDSEEVFLSEDEYSLRNGESSWWQHVKNRNNPLKMLQFFYVFRDKARKTAAKQMPESGKLYSFIKAQVLHVGNLSDCEPSDAVDTIINNVRSAIRRRAFAKAQVSWNSIIWD